MATVACVMRSGGEYRGEHVDRLRRAVARNMRGKYRFVCLDDEALVHGWPGWWSKIELFRPGLFQGRVLYLDLDTVICGPLDELIDTEGVVMLRDFNLGTPASAVMAWDAGAMDHVYEAFRECPDPMDPRHKVDPRQKVYGDQSWIHRCLQDYRYWQDILPGRVIPWPRHRERRPPGASVVCFYANHRPWKARGWARQIYDR